MSDLVKRLRERAETEVGERMFPLYMMHTEAADRIEALEAKVQRLREALRPFAKSKQVFDKAEPCLPDGHAYNLTWNMDEGRCDFTLGQFRRARAAMEPTMIEAAKGE